MCMVCSGMSAEGLVDRVYRRVLDRGWAVVFVEGAGPRVPSYAYTVGLHRRRHPEFVMFGERAEVGGLVLNRVAGLVRLGRTFDEGDDLRSVLPGCGERLAVLRFPDSSTHLALANELFPAAAGAPVPALQLYFPDREPLLSPGVLPRPP